MERLALDVNSLVHARRPRLLPEIEALIAVLPDRACIERSMYHQDAARSGLLPLLDRWRAEGLLRDPIDYRDLPDGEVRFRKLGNQRQWRRLSRRDLATLVLTITLDDTAVLTGERLLAAAAQHHGVVAIDLFDVIRFGLRVGRLTEVQGREMCAEWDGDRFSAGRPVDYSGNFDREFSLREAQKPLSF